jgi:hypothetical protein
MPTITIPKRLPSHMKCECGQQMVYVNPELMYSCTDKECDFHVEESDVEETV